MARTDSARHDRSETAWWETRWFVVAAILIALVPLLPNGVPPLTDLGGHIGRYRVMLGTDADMLSRWYVYDWRLVGNLGVDLIVFALGPLIGLEPAVKLAVMGIVAATVGGILWLSHEAHGRIQPWALLALPLAYNYAFQFGFVNHCLAMALALNAFALWLRLGRTGRLRLRAAVFVPLALLVWVAHVVGWGALGLMVYGAELAAARDRGRGWPAAIIDAGVRCLPLALPLVLLIAWRSGEADSLTQRFFDIPLKAGWLLMVFRDRWPAFDVASVGVVAAMLYQAARSGRVGSARSVSFACLLLLAAFALLPFMLFMSAYADMRLAPYVLILALVSLRAGKAMSRREKAILAMIGLVFFGIRIAGNTASLWIYGRNRERHLIALDHVPRGARLVSFVGASCTQSWADRRTSHLPSFAIARRAAFANSQWRLGGSTPLRIVATNLAPYDEDPSQLVTRDRCAFDLGYRTLAASLLGLPRDRFDYVWLIDPPVHDARMFAGMTPVWRGGTDALYRIEHRGSRRPALR